MKVIIKKLDERAVIPTRGSAQAAGYDLHACMDTTVIIPPGKNRIIPTGLSVQIPDGYFGAIYARSGLATKQGLRPANATGIVDSDYTGPVMVCLYNDSDVPRPIDPGNRIAQLIIQPYLEVEFEEGEPEETERGSGGFGHTGV